MNYTVTNALKDMTYVFPEDDDRLPCGADRNGRHWLRVELSSTLLKYRTALTWQLWKRRPNGVFVQAT